MINKQKKIIFIAENEKDNKQISDEKAEEANAESLGEAKQSSYIHT